MRILVTGGAGFIGGHIAERLLSEGHDITVIDSMDPFYDLGIKDRTIKIARELAREPDCGSYRFVEGDIRDETLVESLMPDVEAIYHQAGRAGVRDSVDDPQLYNEVNVDGSLNVLEAARAADVNRIIMASSSSVYGRPEYLPYDESHPTKPTSPYGVSKLAAERYGCTYGQLYDISVVALRYFTVYGPRMRPNMAMSNFVSRTVNGDPPVIYGDGEQVRDFTFIEDVVDANVELLEATNIENESINIGSTDKITIRALANLVREKIDPSVPLKYTNRHPADADQTHADVTKARECIGYEPEFAIREGLEAFIDWYRLNSEWYGPLVASS